MKLMEQCASVKQIERFHSQSLGKWLRKKVPGTSGFDVNALKTYLKKIFLKRQLDKINCVTTDYSLPGFQ